MCVRSLNNNNDRFNLVLCIMFFLNGLGLRFVGFFFWVDVMDAFVQMTFSMSF